MTNRIQRKYSMKLLERYKGEKKFLELNLPEIITPTGKKNETKRSYDLYIL